MTDRRPLQLTPSGMIGTLVVIAVAALCVRLGFWQLDRLEQRRALNAAVAERMDAAPLLLRHVPPDTAGLAYRRAELHGRFDNARSVVWAGRSHRGSPGVNVLTPLRLEGGGAILVNRGWLPSPDAATIDISPYPAGDGAPLSVILLPAGRGPASEEGPARSLSSGDGESAAAWFGPDLAGLPAHFPYPVSDVYARELPGAGAAGRPVRLPPPDLDEGPHFGYAMQWFSFAAIAVIGWFALVLRGDRPASRRRAPGVVE